MILYALIKSFAGAAEHRPEQNSGIMLGRFGSSTATRNM